MGALKIIDRYGRPMMGAFEGASTRNPDTFNWAPMLRSPDVELLPEWPMIVSRTRDMIRNHGVASGAVQTHLDNVIGGGLRLVARPHWRALGLTAEWAEEWSRDVEAKWELWADDSDNYCDATRQLSFDGLLALGYRSFIASSEILGTFEWRKDRPDRYATCLQMLQPERLSNPYYVSDSFKVRGGVERDEYGAPVVYYIRNAHETDAQFFDAPAYSWRRVPKMTPWGRQQIIHVFDIEQGGQTRGISGFVSILAKAKMLDNFEKASLQAAVINAMYAAVIESSLDNVSVATALGANADPDTSALDRFVEAQTGFHTDKTVRFDGVKIPHLLPGEKLNLLAPQHPTAAFEKFEEAALRHMAAGLNMSYEQLSRDYSKTNYSSARASMIETWRFFSGRRKNIVGARFATPVFANWLEEAISRGDVKLPSGSPDFYTAKAALTRCTWLGSAGGNIDPLKEEQAINEDYNRGTTTLENICAQKGADWQEVLEQRAREKALMGKLGLTPADIAPGKALQSGGAPTQNGLDQQSADQQNQDTTVA